MESCHFGVQKNSPCHKLTYVKDVGVKTMEEHDSNEDEIKILKLRSGLETLETICLHHEYVLLRRYQVTHH